MGNMDSYERDFEENLLSETNAYYKRKASVWIEQDSCPDYMQKAEEHIKLEEDRVDSYLHSSTKVSRSRRAVFVAPSAHPQSAPACRLPHDEAPAALLCFRGKRCSCVSAEGAQDVRTGAA